MKAVHEPASSLSEPGSKLGGEGTASHSVGSGGLSTLDLSTATPRLGMTDVVLSRDDQELVPNPQPTITSVSHREITRCGVATHRKDPRR